MAGDAFARFAPALQLVFERRLTLTAETIVLPLTIGRKYFVKVFEPTWVVTLDIIGYDNDRHVGHLVIFVVLLTEEGADVFADGVWEVEMITVEEEDLSGLAGLFCDQLVKLGEVVADVALWDLCWIGTHTVGIAVEGVTVAAIDGGTAEISGESIGRAAFFEKEDDWEAIVVG